jgi:hypothetical protein
MGVKVLTSTKLLRFETAVVAAVELESILA